MKILRSHIGKSVASAIGTVVLVVVALDAIALLIQELADMKGGYTFGEVAAYVALSLPAGIYNYLPLSCLVGCLIGLGMLAGGSELVVMRAAGVSLAQIIWAVMRPVLSLIFVGILLGEYVTPFTDQYAESRKAMALGQSSALQGNKGVWNREGRDFMFFAALLPSGDLYGVSRFEFDNNGNLARSSYVKTAHYVDGQWQEQDGVTSEFSEKQIIASRFETRAWASALSPELLEVLVLGAENLPLLRLYSYSRYLEQQGRDATEFWLSFWKKALQPFAITSLVMIAISFIFGPLRQVTMGSRIFGGVMVGILFRTSQDLLGPSSVLFGFSPLFAVLTPIAVCAVIGVLLLRRSG